MTDTFGDIVLSQAQEARDGKVVKLPIHLARVSDHLCIRKKVFTLIGSNPGSGKSSFVDEAYILEPYDYWMKNKSALDIDFKVLYVNGERPLAEKLAKWACWKLYKDHKMQLDVSTFLGFSKMRATAAAWDKFVGCKDWVNELLDYVDIKSGVLSPDEYNNWGTYHAKSHGTLLIADTTGLRYDGNDTYIAFFSAQKLKTLRNGEQVQYIDFVDKHGKKHEVFPISKLYIENNPRKITQVVYDHIGKNKGKGTKKDRIDTISQHSAEFRDLYQFSPVLVSQFNRAIGNVDRAKLHGSDLSPSIDDFKDSSNTQEDADVILAMFNAFRYKAFDESGMYMNYAIRDKMLSPLGFNRFRAFTILKNSYGIDDAAYGMKFLGEVMHFDTLPLPDDIQRLNNIYTQIANNL